MDDYRLQQTGQEVQDILNGAAMQTSLDEEVLRAKQAENTLQGNIDNEELARQGADTTLQQNIDAEKTRAEGAEGANSTRITTIEGKIPTQASPTNQLADKDFVNSSIANSTATFRGTYNLLTDLELSLDATTEQIAAKLPDVISHPKKNEYCFVQIPTSTEVPTQIAKIERYKYSGQAWDFEYDLNNSSFTSDQWAAINSGITSDLVTKLGALPTASELATALLGKQDVLQYDELPVNGSQKMVKSGGIYTAIKNSSDALSAVIDGILAMIPSAASALNQLADKAFVNSSISTATATFRGTYNLVTDLELAIDATHEQIAIALDELVTTADNNDYCFVQVPTSTDTPTEIAKTERYKFNGSHWAFEYELNTSGFTAAQWSAINSGITAMLTGKLSDLPTASELSAAFTAITDLIPSEATAQNQLADKAYVLSQILAAIPVFKGQFTTLTELQAVASPTDGDLGIVRTKDFDGLDVFTFYQYLNSQWNVFYTLQNHPQTKPASTGTTGDYPYNGMGRVELEKNMQNIAGAGEPENIVCLLTQDMFKKGPAGSRVPNENTIFVIRYDYVLDSDITIPANCVLDFQGGSISGNYGFNGSIKNDILYAKWFSDMGSFLYTINHLTGYSKIEFETGQTYLFAGLISPTHSVTFKGNGCTIGRSDVANAKSNPLVSISPSLRIDHINFENINFDGGVPTGSQQQINVTYHQDTIFISNVSNIGFSNVKFENFCNPGNTEEASQPDLSTTSNCFIQILQYHNIKANSLVFINNRTYGEVTNFIPVDHSLTSRDMVEITNSKFDFRNGRCYTAINCFGRLMFTNNEIYGTIGGLNAFVNDSVIANNIYADSENGFVDLSEQGMASAKNVLIANNSIYNITKFVWEGHTTNNTHLVECVNCENISIIGNTYSTGSTGNGAVFSFGGTCSNILIKGNNILSRLQALATKAVAGNGCSIVFADNYIYQGDASASYLIGVGAGDDIRCINNVFELSTAGITDFIVRIPTEGETIKQLSFIGNIFNLKKNPQGGSVTTYLFNPANITSSNCPSINEATIQNNVFNNNKCSCKIHNNSGKLANISNNTRLLVEEWHYADVQLFNDEAITIDHTVVFTNNAKLKGDYRGVFEFVGAGKVIGYPTTTDPSIISINTNNTIIKGVCVDGTTGFELNKLCNESSKRPTNLLPGNIYFDITLNKPIWWTGDTSGGKSGWVDATGANMPNPA